MEDVFRAADEIVLRFNGRIEKHLSSVTLVGGPRNTRMLLVGSERDVPPNTLRFALPALERGTYRAEWKMLSVDGHLTGGVVRFTVVAQIPRRHGDMRIA